MTIAVLPNAEAPPTAEEFPRPFRWTVEQYFAFAEVGGFDGRRVELLDGEVLEMSPQLSPHYRGIERVRLLLEAVFGTGYWVRTQAPLDFGAKSMPEPDVAVVRGGPDEEADDEPHPRSALLVVEVSYSTLSYDRGRKAAAYARAGIADYWVLDLAKRRLEVCRNPQNGEYAERKWLTESKSIAPLACPNRSLPVAKMLPAKR